MNKPDYTFRISVHEKYMVYYCAEAKAWEDRGCFGFHSSERCPNCQTVFAGYELWGENGHCQGHNDNRQQLAHGLRNRVMRQWRATTDKEYPKGSLIGYRFSKGSPIRYVGGYLISKEAV